MSTLTLDDIKQADDIFTQTYEIIKQRIAFLEFKWGRSPEMKSLKSIKKYEEDLNTFYHSNDTSDLWTNLFNCVEIGGELRDKALNDKHFVQHCERLLDGSHEMFQYAKPFKHKIGIADVKPIKANAEKLVEDILAWKQKIGHIYYLHGYKFDFCLADLECIIKKCDIILSDFSAESNVTVDWRLLQEWWNTIETSQSIAQTLYHQYC